MQTPERTLSVLDKFFVRFYGDGIITYPRKDIEITIHKGSYEQYKLQDNEIMAGLEAWEREGRFKWGNNEDEYIILNKDYWSNRVR